jgi:hypothetical protein
MLREQIQLLFTSNKKNYSLTNFTINTQIIVKKLCKRRKGLLVRDKPAILIVGHLNNVKSSCIEDN